MKHPRTIARATACALALSCLTPAFYSCGGEHSPFPALVVEQTSPSDSLALVRLIGADASTTDTLRLTDDAVTLYPDTNRYREAYIITLGDSARIAYLRLIGGVWTTDDPQHRKTVAPTTPELFEGRDIDQREQSLARLYRRGRLALVFSDLELGTLSSSERDSLRRAARPDSLHFVYLFLSSSDSAARQQVRQDTLRGTFFSDSIGLVSRVRQLYGLERVPTRVAFVLDSTAHIATRYDLPFTS